MPRPVNAPVDAFAALALNLFILFVAESSRGLVLPTLSAYVARLAGHDGGAGGAALAVSVFSAGRLVAAPLLGMIADAVPYKWLFFACAVLSIGGHALYVAAAALPAGSGAVAAVLASRFLLGVSSGVLGPCRALVSVLTPPAGRTRAFAVLSTAKFCGYALMPFLGTFGPMRAVPIAGVPIDIFTMPGVVLAAANLVIALVVLFAFDARITSAYKASGGAAAPGAAKAAAGGAECAGGSAAALLPAGAAPGALGAGDTAAHASGAECAGGSVAPLPPAGAAPGALGAGDAAAHAGGAAAAAAASVNSDGGGGGGAPSRPLDHGVAASVALFLFLNVLGKGILTQLEVFLAYLYQEVVMGGRGHEAAAALWLGNIGLAGLVTFACLTVRTRATWPPEIVLLGFGFVATGAGAALLAAVDAARRSPAAPALLNAGAVLAWSIGAPIADVVTTSLFSVVVDGRAVGKWMGMLAVSGSVGRVVLPLAISFLGLRAALITSAASTALAVAMLAAFANAAALAAAARCACCTRAGGGGARARGAREEALLSLAPGSADL